MKIVTPDQFWRLDPEELSWLIDEHRRRKEYAGGMSEEAVAELYRMNCGDEDDD